MGVVFKAGVCSRCGFQSRCLWWVWFSKRVFVVGVVFKMGGSGGCDLGEWVV